MQEHHVGRATPADAGGAQAAPHGTAFGCPCLEVTAGRGSLGDTSRVRLTLLRGRIPTLCRPGDAVGGRVGWHTGAGPGAASPGGKAAEMAGAVGVGYLPFK